MIKRLLVPLDGSALAETALPVAAQVARACGGTLVLFRAPDIALSDVPLSVIEAEEERAYAYLRRVALRSELSGISIERKTCCGAVAAGILGALQTEQADLLVMSSHGRSGFPRFALGSVAEQVLYHAPVPVLVLRQPSVGDVLQRTSPVAVVALDGSPQAESALLPAVSILAALAAPAEGRLHLVRVVTPPVEIRASADQAVNQPGRGDRVVQEAEDYLLRLDQRLQKEGLADHHPAVSWSLFVAREIAPTLVLAAEHAGLDASQALFLALASHGRGRWKSPGIAMNIIEHCTLPLLIVHVSPEHNHTGPSTFSAQWAH